jgi:hypothetical protein
MAISKGKIYKYDLKGNFIAEYESLESAAYLNKISSGYLNYHIKGNSSYCHKHIYTKKYYIKLPSELLEHKTKRIYNYKPIYQYSLNGEYLNSYNSIKEASEKTGFIKKYIGNCACGNLGRSKSYKGFLWSYEKKDKLPPMVKNIKYVPIHQYSMEGKYINSYYSIKEASEKLNIFSAGISHCANGDKKTPTYRGFIWSFIKLKKVKPIKPRKKPINVYLNNKFYKTFESQSEIYKIMKISRSTITICLSGKQKSPYKGYTFKYKN